jgi:hypothetical protein
MTKCARLSVNDALPPRAAASALPLAGRCGRRPSLILDAPLLTSSSCRPHHLPASSHRAAAQALASMALVVSTERALPAAAVMAAVHVRRRSFAAALPWRTCARRPRADATPRLPPRCARAPCCAAAQAHGLDAATTRVLTCTSLLPDGTLGAEGSASAAVIVSHASAAGQHRRAPRCRVFARVTSPRVVVSVPRPRPRTLTRSSAVVFAQRQGSGGVPARAATRRQAGAGGAWIGAGACRRASARVGSVGFACPLARNCSLTTPCGVLCWPAGCCAA